MSVLQRQKSDHVRLDRLLQRLDRASIGAEQEEVLNHVARLVFPHAFAEESVLWPVLRRVLPDGDALTLRVEREHQEVNQLWSRLEGAATGSRERKELVERLVEVLREDVRDEEDVLLPRLQEAVSRRRLRQLGLAWEAVRRTAPTRPHPVVSRRPPGNALAALPLTMLDRSRDCLDAVARRSPRMHRPASRASGGLAAAAARVEHLAAFRTGERAETHRR
jgi:hemerythrin superfamily protein